MKQNLQNINLQRLHALQKSELPNLAADIREFLIKTVSETGGHIGANLGTIELTIALHYLFSSPNDMLIFDTGHTGYTHKILTGRIKKFNSLNTYGGMSRFISSFESKHDFVEASHAGTSISLALGRALSLRNQGLTHWTVALIGDGALAEGLALEALNHASVEKNIKLLIVVNDNGYAISPGFGAIHNHLQGRSIGTSKPDPLFTSLGYKSIGPIDGHCFDSLIDAIETAKKTEGVCVLHAKTEKGRGLAPAATHPFKMHFSFPFDVVSGVAKSNSKTINYQDVAALAIYDAMKSDSKITAITPSTLYATGLANVFSRFPDRCFDPGMEEQHAMSMAVGMAISGAKPVLFYQSTFLQRAFDQIIHDVCFANKDILILAVRSGFAGYDNPTHHGIYDLSYLRCMPNLKIYYSRNSKDLYELTLMGLKKAKGPSIILMPYGPAEDLSFSRKKIRTSNGRPELICQGKDGIILAVGNKVNDCICAIKMLQKRGLSYSLVNLRQLKPLPEAALLRLIGKTPHIVSVEEGVLEGGVSCAVSAFLHKNKIKASQTMIGLPCSFIESGSNKELSSKYKLNPAGIYKTICLARKYL